MLHALYGYSSKYVSSERLAQEACELEIDLLKEPIGKQDQYAAAYGGLNKITFYADEHVNVEPIIMEPEILHELQSNLLLFFIGSTRKASIEKMSQTRKQQYPRRSKIWTQLGDWNRSRCPKFGRNQAHQPRVAAGWA